MFMKKSTLTFSTFPADFQKETIQKISFILKSNQSLQLIAPTGAGNSMIARALIQLPNIRSKYFGEEKRDFIHLDGNLLLERNSYNLSRLLLSILDPGGDISVDPVNVQKQIEEKVIRLCSKSKLVIIIDHLEELDFPELKSFFNNIATLNRIMEPLLQFMFLTKKQLYKINEMANFGQAANMLTQNFVFTSHFNKNDTNWFIEEKEKQSGLELDKKQKEAIFLLSGGFPRTIKRLVEALGRGKNIDDIKNDPAIDIPLSLQLEELAVCSGLVEDIPILETYLKNKNEKDGEKFSGFILSRKLTKIEVKILQVLVKNKGDIVDREKGIEAVWGERAHGISDHAYDQIVHRLRKKIENATPKVQIETVRGRGHTLHF
jgi:hypothetical protein